MADFTDFADESATATYSCPIDKSSLYAMDFTDFADTISIIINTSLFYCKYLRFK